MSKNSQELIVLQKQKMLDAIVANFGNVTKAAAMAGIHPSSHYRWLKEDPEYADVSENMKDISFRKIKDRLLEKALEKIDKGDSAILGRMMAIYLKNIPRDMDMVSRCNNVRLVPRIKYIDTREQAQALMRGENPGVIE